MAVLHSCRAPEVEKLSALGRSFSREMAICYTTRKTLVSLVGSGELGGDSFTSPPSSGTSLENLVSQMTESSFVMGCKDSCPKY